MSSHNKLKQNIMATDVVSTMTLDEICAKLGVDLHRRTRLLTRIKDKYSHGIQKLVEYGRAGKLKKAELVMLTEVAEEFIRMTAQKVKKNKRVQQPHGWLYFLRLKSLVRNANGTYNCWVKIGECVEFLARLKQYKGTEAVDEVLCVVPVHNREASQTSAIDYLVGQHLVRGRREYFQVPEERMDEITEGIFRTHILFTGIYVLQSGGTY